MLAIEEYLYIYIIINYFRNLQHLQQQQQQPVSHQMVKAAQTVTLKMN